MVAGNLSWTKEVSATARIHGTYEYDDDDLTPGKKKEGGLHQNLFDEEGNLKGSARFIPDDDQPEEDDGSGYVDPYYTAHSAAEAEAEELRLERERQENAELIAKVIAILATIAYLEAKPHAQRLWRERVGPAIQARRDARARRKAERKERREQKRATGQGEPTEVATRAKSGIVEGTVFAPRGNLVVASPEYRRNMSRSEAQARHLMALAARAFSDEQLRIVANANIVEHEQFTALESAVAELPPAQVAQLIDQLELNPSALADETFDLSKLLTEAAEERSVNKLRDPGRGE